MKSHTGESPVDIINKSFSDIVKAPALKVTRSTVAARGFLNDTTLLPMGGKDEI